MLKLLLAAGPWGLWNYPLVGFWLIPFVDDGAKRAALARALVIEAATEHAKHSGPFNGWMTRTVYLHAAINEIGAHLGGVAAGDRVDVPKLIAKFGYGTRWEGKRAS